MSEKQLSLKAAQESLWQFALALYRSEGVEETLIELQDGPGANVNIILWTCWLEQRGLALNATRLDEAEQAIASWDQSLVQPLRHLRRHSRSLDLRDPEFARLRKLLQEAELLAERQVLRRLAGLGSALESGSGSGKADNLRLYLDRLGASADLQPLIAGMTGLAGKTG